MRASLHVGFALAILAMVGFAHAQPSLTQRAGRAR
jgi:hypothetical protein